MKELENVSSKIITKKTRNLRGVIYSGLGGISILDLVVLFGMVILGFIIIAILGQHSFWISLVILLVFAVAGVMLIVPFGKVKFYKYLIKTIGFVVSCKNYSTTNTEILRKVEKIEKNVVYFSEKRGIGLVYAINSIDISLMTDREREQPIARLTHLLRNIDLQMEFIRTNLAFDLTENKHYLTDLNNSWINKKDVDEINLDNVANQLEGLWDQQIGLENNKEITKSQWFLVIYGKSVKEVKNVIKFNLALADDYISFVEAKEEHVKDIYRKQENYLQFNKKDKVVVKSNYVKVNDKYVAYRKISEFSQFVTDRWLFGVVNYCDCDVNVKVDYLSDSEAIKKLDKGIIRAEGDESKKLSQKIEVKNYYQNFLELLEMLKTNQEKLKMIDVIFTIKASSLKELQEKEGLLKNTIQKANFVYDNARYEQFKTYFNNGCYTAKRDTLAYQEIASSSLASFWPFIPNSFCDKKGQFLGFNQYEEPVFFDVKARDHHQRVSSNVLVFGKTGGGKTFNVSKQLNWLYLNNTKLFIIDPERQFDKFCDYYGGQIIPIGKTDKYCINPLEIFNDKGLMEHISFLEQFFRIMYPNLGDEDFADWQKVLVRTYKAKGINARTDLSELKTSDYPLMADLYENARALDDEADRISRVTNIIWKLAEGADGCLWNQPSSIDLKNKKLVVFDIHELTNNTNIRNAQIFLMLAFLEREIRLNKRFNDSLPNDQKQWICLAVDEAHRMINKNNLATLMFLKEMTKQIRKYQGILYIISQNISDFVGSDEVKTESTSIVNNCDYHFVHHLQPRDIKDYDLLMKEAGGLNNFEKAAILNASQGECLFVANVANRSQLQITTWEDEAEAWIG